MRNSYFARLWAQPALFLLLAPFGAAGDDVSASDSSPPEWYLEEIATLTAGSGRWIADTHVTNSFDIDGENWLPRRSYVWKRRDSR